MKRFWVAGLAGALATGVAWGETTVKPGKSGSISVRIIEQHTPGSYFNADGCVEVWSPPPSLGTSEPIAVWLDGEVLFSSQGTAKFDWQPQSLGEHVLSYQMEGETLESKTMKVTNLAFATVAEPNPPTSPSSRIAITPKARNFGPDGGGAAIVLTFCEINYWTATSSVPWIQLNRVAGMPETPVAYMVDATTNVESRTGYVYVNGHVHTVTQDGWGGANISPMNAVVDKTGGTGSIEVTSQEQLAWRAQADCNWVNVMPTSGTGAGRVRYTVAPFYEVGSREGTLTVADQKFTIVQTACSVKISPLSATLDYGEHTVPLSVIAQENTEWTVESQAGWISVVSGETGRGSNTVTIAIAENPSWKGRSGEVKIGTETFTVTQKGRTALVFNISPETTTASAEGGGGRIVVTATPDLPWGAEGQTNWITVGEQAANGTGNGSVTYTIAPNPTLDSRAGIIVVTPGDASVTAKTQTVVQAAAVSALSATEYEFAAEGDNCEITVTVSDNVQWNIENTNGWLKVVGGSRRVGPGTVTLQALSNKTANRNSGMVTIAKKLFTVSQRAQEVEVEYDSKLFGTDGGSDSISIHSGGQVPWKAVASDKTWITFFGSDSGTGDGEIVYIVAPYTGTTARTGTITVGNSVVYITQRAYELRIDSTGAWGKEDGGAGEFGVTAASGKAWQAITTEKWITLVAGSGAGTGNGTVRFQYAANDTGRTREGKIIVAGEVFTLQQRTRAPFPEARDAEEVKTVLSGATDKRLGKMIESLEEYDKFRAWIAGKGLEAQAVKESAHAWPSYLLGAEELFKNEPVIVLGGGAEAGVRGARTFGGGVFEVSVTVKDGDKTVAVDAGKVAGLFECTGDLFDWTGEAALLPSVVFKSAEGETLLFEVTPGDGTIPRAFLRIGE